ncbi:MAG TPA: hypothetical protein VMA09_17280 [Candidatus Binataceae bacterium]|nr:hypothetical protein [Candidatus Binataceae bacterium]
MPEQNAPKKSFKWIVAVAVIGVAAGCAIGSVVSSLGREPFMLDAVDSTFQLGRGGHACSIAMGLSLPGASLRSAAYDAAMAAYRLVQGARFTLFAKKSFARWKA